MTNNYVKRCFYHGKPGHQIKEFYKRQEDQRKGKQRKHQGCFAGEEDDHIHDLRLFTVDYALSASKGDEDNIWYVDSGASSHMTGNANNLIKEIKQQMSQVFEMKDLGDLHYCLGLEVWKDSGQTFLTQGKYTRTLLERFRMEQCKTAATPLQQNLKLSSDDCTKQVDATLYRQLVGSLIYLMTTRPDLAYSVSVVNQFMSRPLDSHWNATKCVLRYLSGTCNYGLLYTHISDVTLAGYSDSDCAGNLDDCRSITGYAFTIGSGVISWSSKKQSTVALSSCDTEYQALCAATCKAIWLRRLLSDAGESQKEATSIKTDNQSTIKLA
eukprot:PITA_16543